MNIKSDSEINLHGLQINANLTKITIIRNITTLKDKKNSHRITGQIKTEDSLDDQNCDKGRNPLVGGL
jgi:hypothetical protein